MMIQLSVRHRIVSGMCGGYDLQEADIDKKTGLPRVDKKGMERWLFLWHMPRLDSMLRMYVEELTSVASPELTDTQKIIDTIKAEYAKLTEVLQGLGLE